MKVSVYGANTREEGIALRARLHADGFRSLGFVRFAGDARTRVAADAAGRVFAATNDHDGFGWGPWHQANTHSFDRYVVRVMGS